MEILFVTFSRPLPRIRAIRCVLVVSLPWPKPFPCEQFKSGNSGGLGAPQRRVRPIRGAVLRRGNLRGLAGQREENRNYARGRKIPQFIPGGGARTVGQRASIGAWRLFPYPKSQYTELSCQLCFTACIPQPVVNHD